MKQVVRVIAMGLLVVGGVVGFVVMQNHARVIEIYESDLRRSFFVAFLSLAGFLLSLKTFIVVKLKELVYDSESYLNRLEDRRECNPNASHYGSLRHLSELISVAIALSLIASIMQFTLGLYLVFPCVVICLATAAAAIYILFVVLVITRSNLLEMFRYCEEDSKKKPKKK